MKLMSNIITMEKIKRISKKDFSQIILMLNDGMAPFQIQQEYPMYTLEQIFVAARTAGFPYIKREGRWYKCEE